MEDQNLVFCRMLFMLTKKESSWKGRLCCWSSPSLFLGGDRYFEVYVSHAAPAHIRKKYDYMLWQGHASNAWDAKTNFLNQFDREQGDFIIKALRASYGDEWVDCALRKQWVTPDGQSSFKSVKRLIERALNGRRSSVIKTGQAHLSLNDVLVNEAVPRQPWEAA
jgi:hypothetical protein